MSPRNKLPHRSVNRNRLVACSLIFAFSTVHLRAGDEAYQLKVVTDRADAIYKTGQEAKFVITVTKGGESILEGKIAYVVDNFIKNSATNKFPKGEVSLKEASRGIVVKSAKPGFLRCQVTFKTPDKKVLRAAVGAGFSPLDIQPSLPVPDDFDQFWADQKKQLAKVPFNEKLTPVKHSSDGIECFDVQVDCLGGAPVSGYLSIPKDALPKSLSAILWVHGAGVRSSSLSASAKGALAGMISLDINAHGIANGKPAKFYRELSAGQLRGYRHAGRESRETSYFRGMFLRIVRAIDFLTSRPEWNGKVLAVVGHSQGGGQALVAGGIDDRVTLIAPGVPAICDHSGMAASRINGWPKLVPTGTDGKPNPKILQASRYVDAVNFASRCRADAIMSVGFIDAVCPPSSCYAAYNALKGRKQIINEPSMGHAAPRHIHDAFFKRILQHAEQKQVSVNWPRWRGPDSAGSTRLITGTSPIEWTADENLDWKVKLPGRGCSTPIVWGDHIFVTAPIDGKDGVVNLDPTGAIRWQTPIGLERPGKHRNGSGANSSPVTDGKYLFAYFKSGRLAGLDFNGKLLWQVNLQERFGRDTLYWDIGTSPVLTEKFVVATVMHKGESFLVAFHKQSGEIAWKVDRNYDCPVEGDHSYATPTVVTSKGQQTIVVWGAEHVTSHAATDGRVLWSCSGFNPDRKRNWVAVASSVVTGDMLVVPYGRGSHLAGVRLGGTGDVTKTHRLWNRPNTGSFVPTPAAYDGKVYLLGDRGQVSCINPQTGETLWADALPKHRMKYYASPTIADGKLYAAREDGVVFVARVIGGFEVLSENRMGEQIIASPVPIAGRLLLRGEQHLFCVSAVTRNARKVSSSLQPSQR